MSDFLMTLGFDMTTHAGIFWFAVAWTAFVVTVIWVIGLFQGNHSLIDAYYGYGFAIMGWIAYYFSGADSATATAILVMASLHSCRLGFYLSKRWLGYRKTGGGDQRYIGFVTRFAPGYWWKSFFIVLQPQTAMITFGTLPATWGILANDAGNPAPLNALSLIGILVFGIGYYFETVGDGQLQAFKADPHNKGRYLNTGVWTHTRHPNYFGNVTVWWGIYLVAVAGNPDYWWIIIGPIVNTILLTSVVGRAFQDNFMGVRPEYRELMARTRGFLPLPVRRDG